MGRLAFLLVTLFSFYPFMELTSQSWHAEGDSLGSHAYDFHKHNSKLYIAGNFGLIGNSSAYGIAVWENDSYVNFNSTLYNGFGFKALENFKGNIICGGNFATGGGFVANCAIWDIDFSGSEYKVADEVKTLLTYNNKLYVGGDFSGKGYIASHDGNQYSNMGDGFNNTVECLTIYQDNLYAGGRFSISGMDTVNSVAKWDESQQKWLPLGQGLNGPVYDMEAFQGDFYVVGDFSKAGNISVQSIAKWNGSNWSDVGGGLTNPVNGVSALHAYNDTLYIGGDFDGSTSVNSENVIIWDGQNWHPMGNGLVSIVNDITDYNNDIYAITDDNFSSTPYLRRYGYDSYGNYSDPSDNNTSTRSSPHKPSLHLFPNPTHKELYIESSSPLPSNTNVQIFTSNGKKVYETSLAHQKRSQITLPNLPAGIYFLHMNNSEFGYQQKLMVH